MKGGGNGALAPLPSGEGALNRLTSHAPASNQCKQAQGKVSGSAVRHLSAQLKDN